MASIGSTEADDVLADTPGSQHSATIPSPTKEYFQAALSTRPSLADVSIARMALNSEDSEARALATEFYPKIYNEYWKDVKRPRSYHYGKYAAWGILLSWDGHFDFDYQIDIVARVPLDWEKELHECIATLRDAQGLLTGNQQKIILGQLYILVNMIFHRLTLL
jgi:hypothetical protein